MVWVYKGEIFDLHAAVQDAKAEAAEDRGPRRSAKQDGGEERAPRRAAK
jgi:hypothetical protein